MWKLGLGSLGARLASRLRTSSVHYILAVPDMARAGFWLSVDIPLTSDFPMTFFGGLIDATHPNFPYGFDVLPNAPV